VRDRSFGKIVVRRAQARRRHKSSAWPSCFHDADGNKGSGHDLEGRRDLAVDPVVTDSSSSHNASATRERPRQQQLARPGVVAQVGRALELFAGLRQPP
jgi:hypothetical protein